MKNICKLLTVVLVVFGSSDAFGYIDLNMFYFGDTLETSTSEKSTTMFVEGSIGFAIDKKMSYLVGWNYGMTSVSRSTTTDSKYSSTQMGPRFIWRIGKSQNWSLGFGYYLLTTATYDDGTGTEKDWEGSALKFDFGYSFDMSDDLQFGLRGNYLAASYDEQLTGGSNYTEISYKRTHMYPSAYLIWIW